MALDASKTLLLEKQYLYVRASKGFTLEGTSTEKIWTNTGYYRFLVSNVAKTLGNSYVTIHYDSSDLDFDAECSDLFLEEIQNSVTVAVENIQSVLEDFADTNHDDIDTLSSNLGTALNLLAKDAKVEDIRKVLAYETAPTEFLNILRALVGTLTVLGSGDNVLSLLNNVLNAIAGGNNGSSSLNLFKIIRNSIGGNFCSSVEVDTSSTVNINLTRGDVGRAYFMKSGYAFHAPSTTHIYFVCDLFGNWDCWKATDGDYVISNDGIYYIRRV